MRPTTDDTVATVAGKLMPVKAVDAFLDRDSWDIGLSQSTCRRRVLSRLLAVTPVKCHKALLTFDTVSRSYIRASVSSKRGCVRPSSFVKKSHDKSKLLQEKSVISKWRCLHDIPKSFEMQYAARGGLRQSERLVREIRP